MEKNIKPRMNWNVSDKDAIKNLEEQIEDKIISVGEAESHSEYFKMIREIKDTYESILFIDEKNYQALMGLARTEKVIGNDADALNHWNRALDASTTEEERTEAFSLLYTNSLENGDVRKSIDACRKMLAADSDCAQAVISLAEVYYSINKDVKAAVSLLEEKCNSTLSEANKAAFLCECLLAVRFNPEFRNPQIEKSICRRLRKLWTDNETDKNIGLFYIMRAMEKALNRQDYKCSEYFYQTGIFHGSEKTSLSTRFKAIYQYEQLLKDGCVCRSLNQYLTDENAGEKHYKIIQAMILDAIKVQKSLYEIRYNAPLFWKAMGSRFHALEQEMQTLCPLMGEFDHFVKDENFPEEIKNIIRLLIVAPYIDMTSDDKKEFSECCQSVFGKSLKIDSKKILRMLKDTYPLCHEIMAGRFLARKLCTGKNHPVTLLIPRDGWENDTDTDKIPDFFEIMGNQIELPNCMRKRYKLSSKQKSAGSEIEKKYEEQIMFQQREFNKLMNPSPFYEEQQRMEREAANSAARSFKKRKLRKRILIISAVAVVIIICILIGVGIYNA